MSVQEIPLNKIKLSKNSRMTISNEDLSELMSSIKEVGLLQPIGVVKNDSGYEICYGNRRFLAMSKLGKTKISCVVNKNNKEGDQDIKNLTENLQRRNISLAEAGRYIEILNKQGLSNKEIASRLGLHTNYVGDCLNAFRRVPADFRKHLEVRHQGRKTSPGKIAMSTANKIISASKTFGLKSDDEKALFKAAQESSDFVVINTNKYAQSLASGEKNFLKAVKPLRHVRVRFFMAQDELDRLERTHVENGHYSTLNGFFVDVLRGNKSARIKIEK